MKLEAKQRLQATPWAVEAMPQIIPEEHDSRWFEDFDMLEADKHLFDYSGHSVWGYTYKHEPSAVLFVCLDSTGKPVYINEVHRVELSFAPGAQETKSALHGYTAWLQASVAFSKDADRAKLKGLATKIFWDYLATGRNVAVTDSQQTHSGVALWRKLLHTGSGYLTATVSENYTVDHLKITAGDDRWEDATHFQYSARSLWRDSADGKLLRVFVKRDLK